MTGRSPKAIVRGVLDGGSPALAPPERSKSVISATQKPVELERMVGHPLDPTVPFELDVGSVLDFCRGNPQGISREKNERALACTDSALSCSTLTGGC